MSLHEWTPEERDALYGELLELVYDCHPEPEALRARIEHEPALAALWAEVQAGSQRLEAAALAEAPALDLARPEPSALPRRLPRWVGAAAALLLLSLGLAPLVPWWQAARAEARLQRAEVARLVLSGPTTLPDHAEGSVSIETWNADGEFLPASCSWRFLDESGAEIGAGEFESEGTHQLRIPAELADVRRIEVEALTASGAVGRGAFELGAKAPSPLVHLACDKPYYEPGQRVWVRGLVLERLALHPIDGAYHLRVTDALDNEIWANRLQSEEGALGFYVDLAEDAAGGRYTVAMRDADDRLDVESLSFVVRAYQAPQLWTEIELGRATYAPGERGTAEVRVERANGGPAAGAEVELALMLDGAEVWSDGGLLDREGAAEFRFAVPTEVERGEARLVARVVDGGVVESAVEPFVVPNGVVEAALYPEGGELVAGVNNRVYVELTDALERPLSGRGEVVDAAGRSVARFASEHLGRGTFEFVPEAGERYRLVLDEPSAAAFELPASQLAAAALRAEADSFEPNQELRFTVHTPASGPWLLGVYCRGVLVAQDTFQGAGEHALALAPPAQAAGVLRATLFDAGMRPVAERLIHRKSARALAIELAPEHASLAPGMHQSVAVRTLDENGEPVAAVLGLSVTDAAVHALDDEPRLGLADRAWLACDVEELEERGEFLPLEGPDSARRVDLLLGTRGWRRFAWADLDTLLAEHGDAGLRHALREGWSSEPGIFDSALDTHTRLMEARGFLTSTRSESKRALGRNAVLATGLLLMAACWFGLRRVSALRPSVRVAAVAGLGLLLVPAALMRSRAWFDSEADSGPRTAEPSPGFEQLAQREELDEAWRPVLNLRVGGELVRARDVLYDANEEELRALQDELWAMAERRGGADRFDREAVERDGWLFAEHGAHFEQRGRFAHMEVVPAELLAQLDGRDRRAFGGRPGANELEALLEGVAPGPQYLQLLSKHAQLRAWMPTYAHRHQGGDQRSDVAETVYWSALLRTNAEGRAEVEFDLSDRVTTWLVDADAHGAGRVGQAQARFEAPLPFHVEPKLPHALLSGDRVRVPVALAHYDPELRTAHVSARVTGNGAEQTREFEVQLEDGRGRALIELDASEERGPLVLHLSSTAGELSDSSVHELPLAPRGYPHSWSTGGVLRDEERFAVTMPSAVRPGSLRARLVVFPSPLSTIDESVKGLLGRPGGCFEQASRKNYPNVLALDYLRAAGADAPDLRARAQEHLEHGYALLTGYECSQRGYEWFGSNPGHEALSAYGLLQFHDMGRVFEVEPEMLERTRAWLLERRDGEGGYLRSSQALDSFGRAPQEVTDAYVTYALAATGTPRTELEAELARAAERAARTDDAYELAVHANALAAADRAAEADAARERLKRMRRADGGLVGNSASITSSGGDDYAVETTALAVLAWLQDDDDLAFAEAGVEFLLTQRRGNGTFGATQATIQALRALTAHAQRTRVVEASGAVELWSGDERLARLSFQAGQAGALVFEGLELRLEPGQNDLRLVLEGEELELPWTFDLGYHAETPADDPNAAVAIETALLEERVEEGRSVGVSVRVRNRTAQGQPMTMARIGLPAGLELPTTVLDELLEAERFDFWELVQNELVLYWRDLAPHAEEHVHLDALARIPGTTRGAASSVALYYTPDAQRWAPPLELAIEPAR